MDYDNAEAAGRDRQDSDGTPTLAQRARTEALRALMSSEISNRLGMEDIADATHSGRVLQLVAVGERSLRVNGGGGG